MTALLPASSFVVWDYVVFALMLLVSAAIGIYYALTGEGQHSSRDFLMGGRSMSAVPVALSLTAGFMSAITVLATPSEVYSYGGIYAIYCISYVLVVLVSSEVFLPVFYRLGITSTYEYLELRFNKVIRLCGTVMFIVQTKGEDHERVSLADITLLHFTGFHLWGAVISTGVVCTFYCTMGGLKAVVWTDVFQVGIMVAGFLAVIIRSVSMQGGFSVIINDSAIGGRLNFWDTVSSSINGLAAVTIEDLVKPYFTVSERKLSWMSKGLSLLYGALCIGMAGVASLMGGLIQAAVSIFGVIGGPLLGLFTLGILCPFANSTGGLAGLISGLFLSLWVGIGAQVYPPLPENTRPLGLSTASCNFTLAGDGLNVTMGSTVQPVATTILQEDTAYSRPFLADHWYSVSYLYFSPIGTLTVLTVGLIVSLLTGGRKLDIDPGLMLMKEDLTCYHIYKLLKNKAMERSRKLCLNKNVEEDLGKKNPAFSEVELNFTEDHTQPHPSIPNP
ncbi:hypothetical protein JZ751_008808 [Albula glossodonta]|uniref:Sodium-coupled monocarboxylate transporter 1 n=1 Tax=Albula glossodonta TaxID=121402 RepID=A0A8T2NZQ8_9TELE|nr:hypothetical protein JZ751_008808 [Albula glossodonta]